MRRVTEPEPLSNQKVLLTLPDRDTETYNAALEVLVRRLPPEIALMILESGSGMPWARVSEASRPKLLKAVGEGDNEPEQRNYRFFYPIPVIRPVITVEIPRRESCCKGCGLPVDIEEKKAPGGEIWAIAVLIDAECHDYSVISQNLPLFNLRVNYTPPEPVAIYNTTNNTTNPPPWSYYPGPHSRTFLPRPIQKLKLIDFEPGLSPWTRLGRHTKIEWFRPHVGDERGEKWAEMVREGAKIELMPISVKGKAVEVKVYKVEIAVYGGL